MRTIQLPIRWVLGLPLPGVKGPGHEIDPSPPSSADVKCPGGCFPALRMRLREVGRKYFTLTFCYSITSVLDFIEIQYCSHCFERSRSQWPDTRVPTVRGWALRRLRHWVNTEESRSQQNNRPPSIQSQGERIHTWKLSSSQLCSQLGLQTPNQSIKRFLFTNYKSGGRFFNQVIQLPAFWSSSFQKIVTLNVFSWGLISKARGHANFVLYSAFGLSAKMTEYSGAIDVDSGTEKIKSIPTHLVCNSACVRVCVNQPLPTRCKWLLTFWINTSVISTSLTLWRRNYFFFTFWHTLYIKCE